MKKKLIQLPYSPIPQWLILIVFSMSLYYSKEINQYFDELLIDYTENNRKIIKHTIFTIPLFMIFIFDMYFHSFSMNNLLITKFISNEYINYFLRVLGIYGIVQVLSQDFGLKTGLTQNKFTKNEFVHFICMFGAGYTVSGQRSESFIAALIYIFLKKLISNNETTIACFDEV